MQKSLGRRFATHDSSQPLLQLDVTNGRASSFTRYA